MCKMDVIFLEGRGKNEEIENGPESMEHCLDVGRLGVEGQE